MSKLSCHTRSHVLLRIWQETASHNGADAEWNGGVPHKLQALRVRPPRPHRCSLLDLRRNSWDFAYLLRRGEERANECLSAGNRQASSDGVFANISGKFGCELIDEDVVVDGIADGAAHGADREREGYTGGDGGVRADHDGDGGCWDEDSTDAKTCHSREGDDELAIVGGDACQRAREGRYFMSTG